MLNLLRFRFFLAGSLLLFFSPVAARALEVGDPAPIVTAMDQDAKALVFADIYKKGVTLVYFYPKAATAGCTAEACSLRDSYDDLRAQGLQIIGISEDQVDNQKKFHEENKLPFPLVPDSDGHVAKAFGVPVNDGKAKRQSFLIKDGKIAWLDLNASTSQQAADVRAALAKLLASR